MSVKVVGIVGSRRRNSREDKEKLVAALDNCIKDLKDVGVSYKIVSGGCPVGADRFAEEIAKARGLTITIHYPDWNGLGKVAGFARNIKIAEDCDVLIAVVAPDRTGGTEDTVKKALKLGKEVIYT